MIQPLDFRSDIETAAKALNFSSKEFRLVGLHEYEAILVAILDRFTTLGKKGLNYSSWWTALKEPCTSIYLDYAPNILPKLLPSQEIVWFVAEDCKGTKRHGNFWLYEGTVSAIVQLLGEMYGFEYCLVSKKFDWLIGEDDHGVLIGVGHSIVEKIKIFKSSDEGAT